MKRFLRPTGQILTTAVFTSASLNCGYLTARADETQSQPEATASVVDTVPSIAPAPANAPAVAPPETSPAQSAPATSVTVRPEAPKHSKEEAPVSNYVVPTEPAIADPSPEPTPAPAASVPPVSSANQPTEEGNGDDTASATNSSSSPTASQTSNPTAATATAPAGQATADSSSKPSATAANPSASDSSNPAKAAKRSFVIDSLVSAARRQAEAGNFQQAYLIAQDPMLPRDVQASLQAEIRQLEAAAQSEVASATASNSKKAGVTAARPTASTAQTTSEAAAQASEAVPTNAIAETMIASARRQAEAGAFQQAYLIAQDPMLPLDIQRRLNTEIRQLEISHQSAVPPSSTAELATGSATESPNSTRANLAELEHQETAIADTLIAAAQRQAQDGNFAQAYLIAQDPTLPLELQAALQADIQELEAAASSVTTANTADAAETGVISDRADSIPTATPDKRPLKQQEIAQTLIRIALDYAAAGDINAANLIAQDSALSVEQQQDLQRQLAELAAQATDSEMVANSTTSTKPNKVAIADAATAEANQVAEAGTEPASDSQTALVPQASFETFGVDQITMNRGQHVNQPLSPLPSIAYLNSAYSAAFSCSQAAAEEAVAASPTPTAAARPVQPAPDAAKIAANRAASLPLNLSLLNRNGLGDADTNIAIDSRFSVPQATYTAPSTLLEADQQPFEHYVAGNGTADPTFDPTLTFKPFDALSFGFENPAGTLRYVASNFGKTAIANLNIFDKIVAVTQSTSDKSELATEKLSPADAATKALPAPPTDTRLVSNRTGGFETFNPNDLSPKNTDCYPVVTSAMGGQVLATPTFGASGFQFPLSVPAPITSPVGWRIHPISGVPRFHAGTDFGAPTGTPVVAARSGQVAIADYLGGYGATVVIDHPEIGQQTLYAHLSRILVPTGTWVEAGTVIGQVGSTGNSTGPHLHFEVRQQTNRGWVAVNPIRLGQ